MARDTGWALAAVATLAVIAEPSERRPTVSHSSTCFAPDL